MSFEYLCYGSTAIKNIAEIDFSLRIWRLQTSDSETKVDPRAVRVGEVMIQD